MYHHPSATNTCDYEDYYEEPLDNNGYYGYQGDGYHGYHNAADPVTVRVTDGAARKKKPSSELRTRVPTHAAAESNISASQNIANM